ncbi:coenzyme F430 synthase [Methanobacterium oryzae]|uniref:coenzyme F430 synthase n=1 Tax=Methanobacterium oryzae TaxID=69540 RepID=UPI003D1D1340
MNVLVVDMTHGGVLIASEFSKLPDYNVFALDLYNTLRNEEKISLGQKGIKFVNKKFLSEINRENSTNGAPRVDILVIAPIHCNLETEVHITHHEAIKFLMKDKINVPVIEVTGVKGKTSVVWMLKEIFKNLNPLVLSSLGAEILENGKSDILKQNISITPASIIETWEMTNGHENIGISIFETSLGGTGLADVGILTNIAEDYSIASGEKSASIAKAQIFNSKMIACDFDSYNQYYSNFNENVNTFGYNGSNVSASKIKFDLFKTTFKVKVANLKTRNGDLTNTEFDVETFAPAEYHLNNVLCAICASLTLNVPINQIKKGLKEFKGIKGRSSIREYKDSKIIEEINPGINVTAIKKAVEMISSYENPTLIFGGKYGVTCEEINEISASEFLNTLNEDIHLILVDELGKNIKNNIKRKNTYISDINKAVKYAVSLSEMILLIYRSNFSDLNNR